MDFDESTHLPLLQADTFAAIAEFPRLQRLDLSWTGLTDDRMRVRACVRACVCVNVYMSVHTPSDLCLLQTAKTISHTPPHSH